MRKVVSIAVAALLALAMIPSISHASSQCPGIDDNPRDAFAPVPHGAITPSNPTLQAKYPVLSIESGQLLPTYSNPSAGDPTDWYSGVTGFLDLGSGGCTGYCVPDPTNSHGNLACGYQFESGVANTNFLTPQADKLQVVVRYYPSVGELPDPGYLSFKGTASSSSSVCKPASGAIKLAWASQPGSPFHGDGPRWVSQIVLIPPGSTKVNVCAMVQTYLSAPNSREFTTTYTVPGA